MRWKGGGDFTLFIRSFVCSHSVGSGLPLRTHVHTATRSALRRRFRLRLRRRRRSTCRCGCGGTGQTSVKSGVAGCAAAAGLLSTCGVACASVCVVVLLWAPHPSWPWPWPSSRRIGRGRAPSCHRCPSSSRSLKHASPTPGDHTWGAGGCQHLADSSSPPQHARCAQGCSDLCMMGGGSRPGRQSLEHALGDLADPTRPGEFEREGRGARRTAAGRVLGCLGRRADTCRVGQRAGAAARARQRRQWRQRR